MVLPLKPVPLVSRVALVPIVSFPVTFIAEVGVKVVPAIVGARVKFLMVFPLRTEVLPLPVSCQFPAGPRSSSRFSPLGDDDAAVGVIDAPSGDAVAVEIEGALEVILSD